VNLRWLSRNLAARNAPHPDLENCLSLIRQAMRGEK